MSTDSQAGATPADLEPWLDVARREYDRGGPASVLPGEYDLNLRLDDPAGPRLLKVMRPECPEALVAIQCEALERLATTDPRLPVQRLERSRGGRPFVRAADARGRERLVWMVSWLPGRLWVATRPRPERLLDRLGETLGRLARALQGWDPPEAHRDLFWDLRRADWIREGLGEVRGEATRRRVADAARRHGELRPILEGLPTSLIHGDANDHNLLLTSPLGVDAEISGLLDFGDLHHGLRAAEVAVAAAYALVGRPDPVVSLSRLAAAYHREVPLTADELAVLLALVRTRLAATIVTAARRRRSRPEDAYATVSDGPARELLARLDDVDGSWAEAELRLACGLEALPGGERVVCWLHSRAARFAPVLGEGGRERLAQAPVLDLSVGSPDADVHPLRHDPDLLERRVDEALAAGAAEGGGPLGLGRWNEARLVYSEPAFRAGPRPNDRRRTRHLGVDLFAPPGTALHAPLEAVVRRVAVDAGAQGYGPWLLLEHRTDDDDGFHTVWGHLDGHSVAGLRAGTKIAAGAAFARIGARPENGDWPPHLHLQVLLGEPPVDGAPPGVAHPSAARGRLALSPNPAALLGLEDAPLDAEPPGDLLERRRHLLGPSLRLSYRAPLTIVRGWRQLLFDADGQGHLDAYNNVPHVGHAHPRVVRVLERQMRVLNTNTRYLHEAILEYSERLTALLPEPLAVCFFLNSASEANELALRLARAHTGARDLLVAEAAYHGHTTTLVDASPYKFDGPGGEGAPEWVHKTPIPDPYRGPYKRDDPRAGERYAERVAEVIETLARAGRRPGAYLCETLPSVGGQIIPPPGFLPAAFDHVRQAGGLAIADEVQAGFGRVGSHFWAFDMLGAVPDILVLGKPIGSGHPLAAVVTTREIARSFDTGMEFFSTFGGNPVSCAVGLEVLRILEDEGLQENARVVGGHLLGRLAELVDRHPLVGDARGAGLFLGVELVRDLETLEPATREAAYVKERLREERILVGTDGPFDNVLKIRPPMVFERDDADLLVDTLDRVLGDSALQG